VIIKKARRHLVIISIPTTTHRKSQGSDLEGVTTHWRNADYNIISLYVKNNTGQAMMFDEDDHSF